MWRLVEIPIIVTGASTPRFMSTTLAEISMSQPDAKDPKEPSQTLSDADISSERVVKRRSFLSRTGLLVGGALAVAAGVRANAAGEDDPDKDGDDPVSHKPSDPDHKKKKKHKAKATDPDAKRATDPDAKRASDPDSKKSTDPHS
jgi:hypothetical protein